MFYQFLALLPKIQLPEDEGQAKNGANVRTMRLFEIDEHNRALQIWRAAYEKQLALLHAYASPLHNCLHELGATGDEEKSVTKEQNHEITEEKLGKKNGVNRRVFLSSMGAAGVVAATGPVVAGVGLRAKESEEVPARGNAEVEKAIATSLRVNGKEFKVRLDPRTSLLDFLRETLKLTGAKKGCDHGQCGACTVHINGRRINSCLTLAVMHDGDNVTTIEGLGDPDNLHPMQESFLKHDGYQCGYCTSGQIMSAVALLKEKCGPKDSDVKELMSGNICRCGAYPNIVAAIQDIRKGKLEV